MEKIIAILTQKGSLSKGLQENTTVNLFRLENEEVKEVESVKLESTTDNHFSLMMALKKVNTVYTGSINNDLRNVLSRLGIMIKCKDEIANDQFINHFIFD